MLDAAKSTVNKTTEPTDAPDASPRRKVLVLFGTRPEAIKLAPVVRELEKHPAFELIVASSSQHTDLLAPFLKIFVLV